MFRLGDISLKCQSIFVPVFLSFGPEQLSTALTRLGVESGDTLMVHASLKPYNGFKGKPADIVQVLKDIVTRDGILAMPSQTYRDSSKAFLSRKTPMDVRRTASQMGLLSEIFRRGKDVRRSLNPTHPVLAWGRASDWFIADHDKSPWSFGPDSPYGKLLEAHGKVLCIDTPFDVITYTHFLEDRIKDQLLFSLYEDAPELGTVVGEDGIRRDIPVYVISEVARKMRREERLIKVLKKDELLHSSRIGNMRLLMIECAQVTECVERMMARGEGFFENPE